MKPIESKFKVIRQPVVAGQFYPADASELKNKIEKYLDEADKSPQPPLRRGVTTLAKGGRVKAIMVPHAGYDFSAPVAAYAYKQLQGKKIKTAVIICNSHSSYFDGIAVDDSDGWQTSLGPVEVDKDLAGKLVNADDAIKYNSEAHKTDHVLEVQLPFLQTVLSGEFKIVPILFGNARNDDYEKLAKALADNLGGDDIIVVSSDMSHYPSYEDANEIDRETLEIIKTGDIAELENHIEETENQDIPNEQTLLCGIDGVKTVMELYNLLGWDRIEILKYANSGDASIGDPTSLKFQGASKASVVGYGAVAFIKTVESDQQILNEQQQKILLNIARTAVETYVNKGEIAEFNNSDERLNWKEGAFVTLRNSGKLRGCIGRIEPSGKPLWQVVRDMAIAAATEDDRFSPVNKGELDKIDYEISVLSAPEKIDNWQDIELGKHGVIAQKGLRGGVFLPQVADETGWSKEEFLSQLCFQKAGLAPDCYKDKEVELKVFTAQVFNETNVRELETN
ncbi:AmmeMemoRadiSam system protein B [Candidatus Parcubacteria bacterium]|nr:AmmeMemoRadiSam system protein B [Patescibacteria group bacterium]MCG2690555.1 AmmeMemoRadiSam system protein B [Candidatus Parcubacteria bacterium]